jgi:hypothetical protein
MVRSVRLDRGGNPDGTRHFDRYPFGIEVAVSRTFPCGITMPAEGVGGLCHGTDRRSKGESMRYTILDLSVVGSSCLVGLWATIVGVGVGLVRLALVAIAPQWAGLGEPS